MLKVPLKYQVVVVLCALVPWVAQSQPVEMPAQVPDVVNLDAGLSVNHHSNIFRQPTASADTVLRALVGVRMEREFSLQRLAAFATAEPVRFSKYSAYDYVGYDAGAQWDWAIGRPLFGVLSARTTRVQTAFETVGISRNLQDTTLARALAGVRWTQSWSLIGAVDQLEQDNSSSVRAAANFQRTGYEAGVRFAPARASEWDWVYRRDEGRYPNRQVFDATGAVLGPGVDNAFTQDAALFRMAYRPSEASRLDGTLGLTRRAYDNLPQRDFSGLTASMNVMWPLTGATTLRAALYRTLDSAELLSASYVTATGGSLRPVWSVSGRLNVEGLLAYARQSYDGDPGFVLSGAPVRLDTVTTLGARVNYEWLRRVALFGDVQRWRRASNYADFDFSDLWVGVGVRATF